MVKIVRQMWIPTSVAKETTVAVSDLLDFLGELEQKDSNAEVVFSIEYSSAQTSVVIAHKVATSVSKAEDLVTEL